MSRAICNYKISHGTRYVNILFKRNTALTHAGIKTGNGTLRTLRYENFTRRYSSNNSDEILHVKNLSTP